MDKIPFVKSFQTMNCDISTLRYSAEQNMCIHYLDYRYIHYSCTKTNTHELKWARYIFQEFSFLCSAIMDPDDEYEGWLSIQMIRIRLMLWKCLLLLNFWTLLWLVFFHRCLPCSFLEILELKGCQNGLTWKIIGFASTHAWPSCSPHPSPLSLAMTLII